MILPDGSTPANPAEPGSGRSGGGLSSSIHANDGRPVARGGDAWQVRCSATPGAPTFGLRRLEARGSAPAALPVSGVGSAVRFLAILLLVGCAPTAGAPTADHQTAQAAVVDGDLTIGEELDLFRESLPVATRLVGGAASREELARGYVQALVAADTIAIGALVLNASEFAHLYYPHTRFTAPPYELGPGLVWYQIRNGSSKGLGQALRQFADRQPRYLAHRCEPEPTTEGPNRVWSDCLVTLAVADEPPVELRLFGSIIQRDGRFKFVSLANRL